jgi:hypothetical protein
VGIGTCATISEKGNPVTPLRAAEIAWSTLISSVSSPARGLLAPGGEVGNGCRQQRFPDDLAKADVLLDKAETEELSTREGRQGATPSRSRNSDNGPFP